MTAMQILISNKSVRIVAPGVLREVSSDCYPASMKFIETYSLHQAGNITRREAQLPGANELPRLTVTVERGADLHETAEDLRRLAAVFDRQP
jgi:hypothetical protein